MKEFKEKLIGRLEENYRPIVTNDEDLEWNRAVYSCTEIVNQLAEEYNQEHDDTDYAYIELYDFWQKHQWIPCEKDTPKENGWYWGYYVTSSYIDKNGVEHKECKYANIYWEDNLWLYDPRGFRTVDRVVAWQPIVPFEPKGE